MAGRSLGFSIVGVGASAGGVEALEGFLHGLPKGVQHPGRPRDLAARIRTDTTKKRFPPPIGRIAAPGANILALAQSIARRTLGTGPTVSAFMTRLAALGRVQGLFSGADQVWIDLRDIVQPDLQAVGTPTNSKISVHTKISAQGAL